MAFERESFNRTIRNDAGDIVPNAQITVYSSSGGMATIYGSLTGAPKGNPFNTGAGGKAEFYADPGRYDVHVFKGGNVAVLKDVDLSQKALREDLAESDSQVLIAGEPAKNVAALRSELNQKSIGGLVYSLESIKDLSTAPKIPGAQYSIRNFWTGLGSGGGIFVWDPDRPKSEHNGGAITDPDKLSDLGLPSDTDPFGTYFTANTEGVGCFERLIEDAVYFEHFGAVGDAQLNSTKALLRAFQYSREGRDSPVKAGDGTFLTTEPLPWEGRINITGTGGTRSRTTIRATAAMPAIIDGLMGDGDTGLQSASWFEKLRLECNELAGHGIRGSTNHSRFDLEITGATEIGAFIRFGWDNGGSLKVSNGTGSGVKLGGQNNINSWQRIEVYAVDGYGCWIEGSYAFRADALLTEGTFGPALITKNNKGVSIGAWYCENCDRGAGYEYTQGTVKALWHSIGASSDTGIGIAFPDLVSIDVAFLNVFNDHDCMFFMPGADSAKVGTVYLNNLESDPPMPPIIGISGNTSITSIARGTLSGAVIGNVYPRFGTRDLPLFTILDSTLPSYNASRAKDARFNQALNGNLSIFDVSDFVFVQAGSGTTTFELSSKTLPASPREEVYQLSCTESTSDTFRLQFNADNTPRLKGKWGIFSLWVKAEAGVTARIAVGPGSQYANFSGDGEWRQLLFFCEISEEGNMSVLIQGTGMTSGNIQWSKPAIYEVGSNLNA